MNIREIYEEQYKLLEAMGWPAGKPVHLPVGDGNQEAAKSHLLAAIVECTEALNEINWKPWKKGSKAINYEEFTTELMDIIQFVINAAIVMDVTPRELESALRSKWLINYQRIQDGGVTNGAS